jgi:two-component system OmpR family sensor kinase
LLQSEKRSLIRFLVIYLFSTFILFSLASWIFYLFAKQNIIQQQKEMMKVEATHLLSQIRLLHQSNAKILYYPKSKKILSAIYDLDKDYIFGTLSKKHSLDQRTESHTLHYVVKLEPYYLGAAYLLVQKHIDTHAIEVLQKQILFFMLGAGIFFTLLGYFLGRLFVAPMRDAIEQMNQFIQDTTHELNTPISTILTNVELLEALGESEAHSRELTRIEIASKTLSRIYDDLTYLNLNHHYHREMQNLDLSSLLHERVLYFSQMAEAKGLKTRLTVEKNVIRKIDRNDALRLIDNLLSNAIKYNKKRGSLHIILTQEYLSIEDTGIGINSKYLGEILQRFKRANSSEGGFGIGLHIVSKVCENYEFTLEIESMENIGTKVVVEWEK